MSTFAINAQQVSKQYILRHEDKHDSLRDTLQHTARKMWRKYRWGTGFSHEEFWALKDVSFQIPQGEVVGIVGRNGAGKSTLLKILSRITEPTSGEIALRGRIASLLEVGTGFHPELSGRENIFLNGAVLGMQRKEIKSKFDEIVAFAEIERFLDTPVKRYSSGMYVRLAFAVAAHLEPDILIVDEVLAVGDANFQKKCLGKIESVSKNEGRTVLFVSHSTGTIARLCNRALFMANGQLVLDGPTQEVLRQYLSYGRLQTISQMEPINAKEFPLTLLDMRLVDNQGQMQTVLPNHLPASVQIRFKSNTPTPFRLSLKIATPDNITLFTTASTDSSQTLTQSYNPGEYLVEIPFPTHLLNVGQYNLSLTFEIPKVRELLHYEYPYATQIEATGGIALLNDQRPGLIMPLIPWKIQQM